MARGREYVDEVREANEMLWKAFRTLKSLQPEYTYNDYGNTLDDDPETFTGTHTGLDVAKVTAVVFTTTDALEALFNAGHGTNIAALL